MSGARDDPPATSPHDILIDEATRAATHRDVHITSVGDAMFHGKSLAVAVHAVASLRR